MAHRQHVNRRRGSQRDSSPLRQDPQDVMSTAMRLQWNIRVLQRHDPQITDIVDQFTYAVLYRFEEDQWVKKGVEGSMFIYTRTDAPRHGICILNREGVGNYVLPLRRGDDMEVTENYIIYRPVDVPRERFEDYLGIWTADLGERARLGEFMTKIKNHIAKTDVPYTPVLLHMPATDPDLPPMTLQSFNYDTPNRQGKQHKNGGSNAVRGGRGATPTVPPQPPAVSATVAPAAAPSQAIESLFAKLAVPGESKTQVATTSTVPSGSAVRTTTTVTTSTPPQGLSSDGGELRGQSLLQSIFASAATGTTTTVVSTSATATPPRTSRTPVPAPSNPAPAVVVPEASAPDLLNKLLVGLQQSSAVPTTPTRSASSSSFPPSTPFVEDDDSPQTSPRRQPQASRQQAKAPTPAPSTPPVRSQRAAHPKERELVPYDLNMPDGTQIVTPWANRALEENPPSPSRLPQPKAVRERKGRHQRHGSNGSPHVKAQSVVTNGGHTEPRVDRKAAVQATAAAMSAKAGPGLSKQDFTQELLTLIQTGDFVDLAYKEYSSRASKG